jgi:hypothetical protein
MHKKVMRPEGLELSTFWFVAKQGQNLNACSGVTYGLKGHHSNLRNGNQTRPKQPALGLKLIRRATL